MQINGKELQLARLQYAQRGHLILVIFISSILVFSGNFSFLFHKAIVHL